ncbi:heavy-metal-associated domain-containing protein [Polaribacter sp.]|uniref:heavy-metal-associated domain-containing protein n=1 Tax=Polaribacter sp. TaxID=1920175 RepID=UPI003EF5BC61
MSLLSDNVIPGNHGKVFETNVIESYDLQRIKNKLLLVDGIKDVLINPKEFPKEFTVHTSKLVPIKEIEAVVISLGFHAVEKALFKL